MRCCATGSAFLFRAAELAKLLRERLMVVYLDAAPGLRETRSAAGPADVRERDAVKRSRGAERIRELADVLIDNNGPRLALYRTMDSIAASNRWQRAVPRRIAVADLGLPSRLASPTFWWAAEAPPYSSGRRLR